MSNVQEKTLGAEDIRWDLSELFSGVDDPTINTQLNQCKEKAETFEKKHKGRLSELTAEQLNSLYIELENMMTPLYKIGQFVSLLHSTDVSNDEVKALDSKVDEISSKISNHLLFFDLELGAMSESEFKGFDDADALKNYAYSLKRTRETASYNLSESEEKVMNLKDLTGVSAHQKLYEELAASFEFEFEIDGQVKKMNGSELRALRQHSDPDVRRRAMKLFLERYKDNKLTFTHLYNNIVKDFAIEVELRNYPSAISRRNIGNDLPDKAIGALHEITADSYSLVQRYYKLKSKLIKIEKMTLADIYAPMPEAPTTYNWDEAKSMVLEGFSAFDSEFYDFVKRMFDNNRIDAPVTAKKRGGAFCSSSTPDIDPFVLLNFLGKPRDVATLAHELGHALHDMYCSKQTLTNYHPILPLAETASVFSEMIITDLLLKNETNKASKIAILCDKIEDIFATSHRQNMFSTFEMKTHQGISKKLLSSDELASIYSDELNAMFGNAVQIDPEFHWEWSAVPHIFQWPFYVYAYNFGNLLVMALYQCFKEEGQAFIPKFKDVLRAGSAMPPQQIAGLVGADIENPEFWKKSMAFVEGMLSELESLVD